MLIAEELEGLEQDGHLPEKALIEWRAPWREIEPNPLVGLTVLFVPYLWAGLHFPEGDFLIEVLNHYGIELVHLVSNSVLVLSVFAHMFEAFLEIAPRLHLFRFYYQIIHNKKGAGALGSFYFKFQDASKRVFPFLATKDANQSWSKEWFYSEVLKESRITYNRSAPPEWSTKNRAADEDIKLTKDEKKVVLVISNLVEGGLSRQKSSRLPQEQDLSSSEERDIIL